MGEFEKSGLNVNIKLVEMIEKECSFNIGFYGGNLTISVFDRSVGNKPAIRVAAKTSWDHFLVMMTDAIENVLKSTEPMAIALTHNDFLKDQRQYKVNAVFIINKNKDGVYSLITKSNNYTHEFIFSITNTFSIGSNGLKDNEKSEIAIKAFLARLKESIGKIMDIKIKEAFEKANNDTTTTSYSSNKEKPKDDFNFSF